MKVVSHFSSRLVLRATAAFVVLMTVGLVVVYKANLPPPPAKQSDVEPLMDFVERPFVFYTISYHAAPVHDLADLLGPLGVQFIEKSRPLYCRMLKSCGRTSSSGKLKFIDFYGGPYSNWEKKASVIVNFVRSIRTTRRSRALTRSSACTRRQPVNSSKCSTNRSSFCPLSGEFLFQLL